MVVYIYFVLKDLKYILDHCTKLTKICCNLDTDTLESISPHLALKGCLDICEEVSIEQLKVKLPNLVEVSMDGNNSDEYITKFCSNFPLLNTLIFDYFYEGSDIVSTAISSLQNLRTLDIENYFTEGQVYTIVKNLTNLEDLNMSTNVPLHRQSFLCLAKMPRLRKLRINMATGDYIDLDLFTNKNNFPELKRLYLTARKDAGIKFILGSDTTHSWDEVRTQFANYRPTTDFRFHLF